jgi:hypothetical protein
LHHHCCREGQVELDGERRCREAELRLGKRDLALEREGDGAETDRRVVLRVVRHRSSCASA